MRRKRSALPRMIMKKWISPLISALLFGIFYAFFAQAGDTLSGSVVRVVDGDTIHVTVAGERRTVRLIGVDTPETVHPNKPVQYYGKEASGFTKKNLAGKKVWLEYDAAAKDRYGRHLAYVWLTKPGAGEDAVRANMFNARLILDGFGQVMTIQPNSKYAALFAKFQQEARVGNRGLWKREK